MSPQKVKKTVKHILKSLCNKVREVWIYLLVLSISNICEERANEILEGEDMTINTMKWD